MSACTRKKYLLDVLGNCVIVGRDCTGGGGIGTGDDTIGRDCTVGTGDSSGDGKDWTRGYCTGGGVGSSGDCSGGGSGEDSGTATLHL